MFGIGKLKVLAAGGILALLAAWGLYTWYLHHELAACHASNAAITQAAKDTTNQAKREQQRANHHAAVQKKQVASEGSKAVEKASVMLSYERSRLRRTQAHLREIEHNRAKGCVNSPVPVSVLDALRKQS